MEPLHREHAPYFGYSVYRAAGARRYLIGSGSEPSLLRVRLVCGPGASGWFGGAVVAYSSEVKHELLGAGGYYWSGRSVGAIG
jgi:hypothetical protein